MTQPAVPYRSRPFWQQPRKWIAGYLFAGPAVLLLIVFSLISIGVSLYLSFFDYDIISRGGPFIGLGNYREALFKDDLFWTAMLNTAYYAAGVVPAQTVTGLTNGGTYTFTVQAVNAVGTSPASSPSAALVVGTPAAPGFQRATAGSQKVTVAWWPPAANGSTDHSAQLGVAGGRFGGDIIDARRLIAGCQPFTAPSHSDQSRHKVVHVNDRKEMFPEGRHEVKSKASDSAKEGQAIDVSLAEHNRGPYNRGGY